MLIFAFESSAAVASVALWKDGVMLGESSLQSGNTHSTTLLPLAQRMLLDCRLTLDEVDAFACAVGPGSFTGLRIGVATVKGLAFGRSIPCVGVSTLHALARAAVSCGGIICPLINARRGQFYSALFRADGTGLARLTDDAIVMNDTLASVLGPYASAGENVTLTGDGAPLCVPYCASLPGVRVAPSRISIPSAFAVAEIAAEQLKTAPEPSALTAERLIPVYLRVTEAEQRLKTANNAARGDFSDR